MAPLEVDVVTETFVDTTRPTAAGVETPAEPDRTVVTRIAYPTDGGPYPLVVLSHGLTGHPDEYTETVPMWAADGFVVASGVFPLTNRDVPGARENVGDVANQPGDVSFVIDEVLAANDDPASPLHGLVDPEAIGVVGHSLAGATTWAVSFNTARRDERIDSTVIFAGLTLPMPGGEYEFDSGSRSWCCTATRTTSARPRSRGLRAGGVPKWFVTLLGAEHVPAFTDGDRLTTSWSPARCSTSGTAPSTGTPRRSTGHRRRDRPRALHRPARVAPAAGRARAPTATET